jgi:hypothetical protein
MSGIRKSIRVILRINQVVASENRAVNGIIVETQVQRPTAAAQRLTEPDRT